MSLSTVLSDALFVKKSNIVNWQLKSLFGKYLTAVLGRAARMRLFDGAKIRFSSQARERRVSLQLHFTVPGEILRQREKRDAHILR